MSPCKRQQRAGAEAGLAAIGIETAGEANAGVTVASDGTRPSEPTSDAEPVRQTEKPSPSSSSRRPTKQDEIIALLSREEGLRSMR